MLHAPVPRNLRVRPSVQVAGQRLPTAGFILVAAAVFLGGIALVFGADLERVVWAVALAALLGLIFIEGRLWGRSSHEVARLILRHYRRPRFLRPAPITVVLPPQAAGVPTATRRPRWMKEEDDERR